MELNENRFNQNRPNLDGQPGKSFTNVRHLIGTENVKASTPKGKSYWEELLRLPPKKPGIDELLGGDFPDWLTFSNILIDTNKETFPHGDPRKISPLRDSIDQYGKVGTPEQIEGYALLSEARKVGMEQLLSFEKIHGKKELEIEKAKKAKKEGRVSAVERLGEIRDSILKLQADRFKLIPEGEMSDTGGPTKLSPEQWSPELNRQMEGISQRIGQLKERENKIVAKFPDLDPVAGMKALGVDKTQAAHKVTKSVKSTTQIDTPDALEKKYPASQYVGKIVRSTKDGQRYKSDGLKWVKIK